MVPEGWREVRLGDVADRLTRRNSVGNSNVLTISAQQGLVSQEHYFNRRVASRDLDDYFLLRRGDFAYSKSSSQGFPAGAIKRLVQHEDGVVSPLYICFAARSIDAVNADFLAYYLESEAFYRPLSAVAQQGARAHGLLNVRPDDFFGLPLVLPPLDEQRRIAAVLQAADDAVAAAEAVIAQTEKVKRGLVEQLLTRGMPGRHTRFKMTEIGEVPESWEVVQLGDVAEVTTGFAFKSEWFVDGGVPLIRMSNLRGGRLALENAKYLPREFLELYSRYVLAPGDFVFGLSGSLANFATVDSHDPPTLLNQRVGRFVAHGIDARFLRRVYLAERVQREVVQRAGGAAQLNISPKQIEEILLPVPPAGEQIEVVELLDAEESMATAARAAAAAARCVRDGLAADLLTGRVRVPA
jgi:type I restriction enzyme S subunit